MFKIVFLILTLYFYSNAAIYKDMLDNEVEIKKVEKIYASSPVLLYSLYVIDKSKIAGLNFRFNEIEREFLEKKVVELPIVGGWFGPSHIPNTELILKMNPDVILVANNTTTEKIKNSFGSVEIPLFYLKSTTLENITNSFSYLGKLTSNEKRADELSLYANDTLNLAKELSKKITKKPKVYYAQGVNGLQTECHTSSHAELINLAHADNVHKCETTDTYGKQSINFEQVLSYNPEIILVYEKEFYKQIHKDPKWKHIDAVKNKRVYFLPKGPFSWFDRPPTFMKLIGLKWLLSIFHSNVYKIDINKEAKEFYSLFLDLNLTNEQLNKIMGKDIE